MGRCVRLLAVAMTLAACAGPVETEEQSAPGDATVADSTTLDVSAPLLDVAVDVAAEIDTAAPVDVPAADPCPGGAGCPCTNNADCDAALCIDTPKGRQCARTCVDQCPDGFKCAQVTVPGGDVLSICVPGAGRLCDPCASSKDCAALGLDGSACIDQGKLGTFCGLRCEADGECPKGYGCQPVSSTEKAQSKQCVRLPADGESGKYGVCTPVANFCNGSCSS